MRMWGKKRKKGNLFYYLGIPLVVLAGYQLFKKSDMLHEMFSRDRRERTNHDNRYEEEVF